MLKDVDRLSEQNPIYGKDGPYGGISLEELHQDVSKYELPLGTPESVQRSFDAARHAYIYSYYSYDLLTPGAGQLFACLELALRKRLGISWDGKSSPGLFKLLNDATKQKIISSEVGELHKLRNIFQHGTEAIIDPSVFLNTLERVTALLWEMHQSKGTAANKAASNS